MHKHNSHQRFFRCPLGPATPGQRIRLRFYSDDAVSVSLRIWNGSARVLNMVEIRPCVYEAEMTAPDQPGLVWYDFILVDKRGNVVRYGTSYDQLGGEGAVYQEGGIQSFQLTVYAAAFKTPRFLHEGNIYQIFPDRFFKAPTAAVCDRTDITLNENWEDAPGLVIDNESGDNTALDFFGGTLNGIKEKLPYLRELGITVIYLNPVFRARSNHRYDTGDYENIDPLLGTNAEFQALCAAAKAQGIRLVLDGVFSHTGMDSRYFNKLGHYDSVGAYQSEQSPYAPWYTFKHFPDSYEAWWGIPTLPTIRKNEPTYKDYLFHEGTGIVPRWLHAGASGWRLDVADELPMDFIAELRRAVKGADPEACIYGEVWEDASNKISYNVMRCYCMGDTLDSVMNYTLREAVIAFLTGRQTAGELARLLRHQQEVYPVPFLYAAMNLLDSHDRARIINVLADCEMKDVDRRERAGFVMNEAQYELGKKRAMAGYALLCALPGAPTIFYGGEAGLQGTSDPFCRGTYPWGREDQELLAFVKGQLNARKNDHLLHYGLMAVDAPDNDTIRILRYYEHGKDAFGQPAPKGEPYRVITIKRV